MWKNTVWSIIWTIRYNATSMISRPYFILHMSRFLLTQVRERFLTLRERPCGASMNSILILSLHLLRSPSILKLFFRCFKSWLSSLDGARKASWRCSKNFWLCAEFFHSSLASRLTVDQHWFIFLIRGGVSINIS